MAAVAAGQFGRVSAGQLKNLGVDRRTIARWTAHGYLHRRLRGVYAVGHVSPSVDKALLYAGPGAMLSHGTAIWWLGLSDRRPYAIDVSTPGRCRSVRRVRVHARRSPDRLWHRGLPITPISTTLRDYAATVPLDQLRYVVAEAEYHNLLDIQTIKVELGRGKRGAAKLRRALERHEPRLARTRSRLERRFLELCESAGIPSPRSTSRSRA